MSKKLFKEIVPICIILLLSVFLRFVSLDNIPAGLYVDEASLGYNAYSLLNTGKDEYGQPFPIFLRSFGDFKPALYAYFTTIPIALFGLNIFSIRFLSALSGTFLVLITYLILKRSKIRHNSSLAILSALVLSLSPWAIFQSRVAVEANFALIIFATSMFFFILSIKRIIFFIPATATLAFSAYAYHAERVLSFVFLILIIIVFKKNFIKNKKIIFIGIIIFFLISLPQLLLLTTPGSLQRFNTQGFTQKQTFEKYGGTFKKILVFGRSLYILNKFSSQYISSYSPRSLFFEAENQSFRSMPDMSVFYFWMIIPFFLGIKYVYYNRTDSVIKLIFLCIAFGSLPAALTGDPFYTLRMLPTLWGISILISFGLFNLLQIFHLKLIKYSLGIFLGLISCLMLYMSYFIIFKSERSSSFGYPYLEVANLSEKLKDQSFVLDTEIYDAPYILMATYKKTEPYQLQKQTNPQVLRNYYTNVDFNKYRKIDNIDIRNIRWDIDQCANEIIVTDDATLSKDQAKDHAFTLSYEFKDLLGKTILYGYSTNPQLKCAP
ncbi:MAG: hypothetical protein ACD_32C00111G0004 [uncultured bacterium]|uniref:ArnT-like N-terminal domain-containing protein n=1 Tax=Candidatus Daviesbacteria bacterium GW2011_GWC2_40_12 TaxID=1618431 RepID=A0A0G0QR71_9BACT|nr:MAG: hypothetical protein ACD_32C00111G0004 [uncultured bacterium]KKR17224.1 MAG: hypothetical protein UT45_C0002G0053 [Candidatus Daviesbacteria bacterium GW2011_GWA2_39_33]KKR42623.1 MAG: hypothetical protein UT77_C0001G0074 [Candidatus Daviesbacteria bacterium GW2011_GWC2_40_12]OGE21299.1 MAG: hypothetical protein A2778_03980 [Candidatus Daviesbacteria bacterium RIFCSPHIGHO2_01_FULL_40_24]OGE30183.1 MAG: hypothetical protein A3C29_02140 [Candidatus Daviesbacteria bacterium RIFCSPHIGHO2_02